MNRLTSSNLMLQRHCQPSSDYLFLLRIWAPCFWTVFTISTTPNGSFFFIITRGRCLTVIRSLRTTSRKLSVSIWLDSWNIKRFLDIRIKRKWEIQNFRNLEIKEEFSCNSCKNKWFIYIHFFSSENWYPNEHFWDIKRSS